jgi:hypothetical protein
MAAKNSNITGNVFLVKLNNNLNLVKSVKFPKKYSGEDLKFLKITNSKNEIILLFEYYETSGDNRFVLAKTVFDLDLSNPVKFETVEDIPTQGAFIPYHKSDLYFSDRNNDAMVIKVPRDAYPAMNKYVLTSYNSDFTEKKWSSIMDLDKLTDDFTMREGKVTEKKEFVFVMSSKLKAFTKVRPPDLIICKYTKGKILEVKDVVFDPTYNFRSVKTFIDSNTNEFIVCGSLFNQKSNGVYIKRFDINTLEETSSLNIDLGPQKTNGLNLHSEFANSSDFMCFGFNWMNVDVKTGETTLLGQNINNYDNYSINNPLFSGTILFIKLDKVGKLITKEVLPRSMSTKGGWISYFSSYTYSITNGKTYILYYDDVNSKNGNVKNIQENAKQDLFMVTIDENNVAKKSLLKRDNKGQTYKLNKKQNFEVNLAIRLRNGKMIVSDETNVGLLSIE